MTLTTLAATSNSIATAAAPRRKILTGCLAFFIASFVVLFMAMPRSVNNYDEGITLTGAMRVQAGQIPHRDFYAIYGPAEFYSFALLFKLFGQTLLAERILSLSIMALTVVAVYAIACRYCRRSTAATCGVVTLLWLYGINIAPPAAVLPVAVLNIVSCTLLLPVFAGRLLKRQAAFAGALAGLAALYRYDTGAALLFIQVFILAFAAYRRRREFPKNPGVLIPALWPYLLAFAVITLPPVLYYLSVAPLHDFVHDILIYPAKHYRSGRGLPFPRVDVHKLRLSFPNLGVYLPVAAMLAVLGLLLPDIKRGLSRPEKADHTLSGQHRWKPFLFVFSLLASGMYFKGIVRIGPGSIYVSLLPTLLLIAVLYEKVCFEKPLRYSRLSRLLVSSLTGLTLLITLLQCINQTEAIWPQRSVPGRILRVWLFPHRPSPGTQATWCKTVNPITRGFCFLPDDGRVNTIEFLASHTLPGQTLFVGLDHNDKVFANDNMLYFATQRLPATKWSHYDPDLQNTTEIQQQMIRELDRNAPPYIVLDSEFKDADEPNDSSRSTGVLLLDNYIHSKYRYVQTFDEMAIWQRNP